MAKKEVKNSKDKTTFFKSFKAELKKVVWPTPKQLFNNTAAVLAIVIITALIVFILDFAFESANKYGLDKIKNMVVNSTSEENTTESNETVNGENEAIDNGNVVVDSTENTTTQETTTENTAE